MNPTWFLGLSLPLSQVRSSDTEEWTAPTVWFPPPSYHIMNPELEAYNTQPLSTWAGPQLWLKGATHWSGPGSSSVEAAYPPRSCWRQGPFSRSGPCARCGGGRSRSPAPLPGSQGGQSSRRSWPASHQSLEEEGHHRALQLPPQDPAIQEPHLLREFSLDRHSLESSLLWHIFVCKYV